MNRQIHCWVKDGEFHRVGGPAVIYNKPNRLRLWFLNGKIHRENGPALQSTLLREWWVNGKKHRLDGPAVINDWLSEKSFYIDGEWMHEEKFWHHPDVIKSVFLKIKKMHNQ